MKATASSQPSSTRITLPSYRIRKSARKNYRFRKQRAGAVLLEFAITIPVMMILAIAVLDFSRLSYYRFLVADAAGAASRYAAFHPVTDVSYNVWMQKLDTIARNTIEGSPWASASDLIVYPAVLNQENPGDTRVIIKMEYVYHATIPWPGLPSEATVRSTVQIMGAK